MRLLLVAWLAAALAACSVKPVTFTPEDEAPMGNDGPPTCTDAKQNGSETGVDCGGACGPCEVGTACAIDDDCTTRVCDGAICRAATCSDATKNGDETAVDCGGACAPCADTQACAVNGDCASKVCDNAVCIAPTCSDAVQNADETDRDCGGATCAPCNDNQACAIGADCTSKICTNAVCQAPTCSDATQNADETDRDCGGTRCGPCADAKTCALGADCLSKVCANTVCQAATCTDNTQNADETDTDCGGAMCGACAPAQACKIDNDCASAGVCDNLVCRYARSCLEIYQHRTNAADGVYTIAPQSAPFAARCDMQRGGWTLLLKANGDAMFNYDSALWDNDVLVAPDDLATSSGNSKYPAFTALAIAELTGELEGYRFTKTFTRQTAQQIFANKSVVQYEQPYPFFNTADVRWSTQPNCNTFGINTSLGFAKARFGWSANQETDCASNDTAIGFGLIYTYTAGAADRGAGFVCASSMCSNGNINQGGNGLLWGR